MSKTWDVLIQNHGLVKEVAYEAFKKSWRKFQPWWRYQAMLKFGKMFGETELILMGEDLPYEEVVWEVREIKDGRVAHTERLVSVLGCCGLSHLTYEFDGIRAPIFLDFYEKDGELYVNVEIGRVLKFTAIICNHDGKKGLDALYKELGREAVERHLERAKKHLQKHLEKRW